MSSDAPLWTPTAERVDGSRLTAFRTRAEGVAGRSLASTVELHHWSVEEPGPFWDLVWDDCGVVGDRGTGPAWVPGDDLPGARFFDGARLNLAENCLVNDQPPDAEAIAAEREDGGRGSRTWAELRAEVAAVAAGFAAAGVGVGDRVAAWMPNVAETVVAMLAASSLGAVFCSTSSDFGVAGVVDRFGQIEPTVLVAADGYRYGGKAFDCLDRLGEIVAALPTLQQVVVVGHLDPSPDLGALPGQPGAVGWTDLVARHRGAEPAFVRLPPDHPAFVLFSSGTTGKPKCIVHRAGGVLVTHLKEHQLHLDVRPGDRVFYFTTCGWMMWNWLATVLASGATIVLFDGSPTHPGPDALFDLAERQQVTLLGVSAKFVDTARLAGLDPARTHDLSPLRTVCSTGSPLSSAGFAWVYEHVAPDVHLASIAGGTDLCGCFVIGDPTRPVHAGQIQGPALGMAVDVFDDDGSPVPVGAKGELVCTQPFPSMPVGFWHDDDGSRYRAAYFDRFPGVWAHGDFAEWTPQGGMVIHGRSDATLNASGVRIGTAEIYEQVAAVPGVVDAVAVGQAWDGDTRIVLFVVLDDGVVLGDELVGAIRSRLRTNCSPRHVPARVAAVADVPRTRSGKIAELAVADVVNGREPRTVTALANPESLALFRDRPELAV